MKSNNDNWETTIREIRDYAQEQYDKLIVYLSSGGLVLSVGFVKDIVDLDTAEHKWLLITSWGGFILSLILILLSHKSAIKAMTLELDEKPNESDRQDKITNKLNWGSFVFLIFAIVIFISFIITNI